MSDPGALTVRITKSAHATLRALAAEAGEPMTATLAKAIEAYRRQRYLDELNAGFESLRRDASEWEAERAERAEWDASLADGLE